MNWFSVFVSFFTANVLGYGGGPAIIPLIYTEIVTRHHWLNNESFTHILALGNALPGPIATKIAAFVGYEVSGWAGLILALIATVVPSAIALIWLSGLIKRYRQSSAVQGMTLLVQPVIVVMMAVLTWQMAASSFQSVGIWHGLAISAIALWAMRIRKIHPAAVILAAFLYGGLVLPYIQ